MIANMDDLIGSEQVDLVYNYCNFSRQNFPPEFMIGHTQSADPRFPNMVRTTTTTPFMKDGRFVSWYKTRSSLVGQSRLSVDCSPREHGESMTFTYSLRSDQ